MLDELSSQLASLRIDRGKPLEENKSGRWVARLTVLGGAAVLAYAFVLPKLRSALFQTEVEATEVASVSPAQAAVRLTSVGFVVPQRVSHIVPKIAGKVATVSVQQGQHVETGQELLTLDATDDLANIATADRRMRAAKARAASSSAAVATLRAELAEGKLQFERRRSLASQGVAPSGEAQDLEAHVESLRRRAEAARADAVAAAAQADVEASDLEAMRTRLENLTLRSPISGTVVTRPPQPGEVVSPQPPGVSVDMGSLEVADFGTMTVETDVPEQRLSMVLVGAPTEIALDAFPTRRYRGEVSEITPVVDRAKATVMVRVAFIDEKTGVLPDMAARVNFLEKPLDPGALKEPPKAVVTSSAVAERGGEKVVFVIEDDIVHMAKVTLGPALGGGFELLQGPRAGTRLAANAPEALADGQRVKVKEAE